MQYPVAVYAETPEEFRCLVEYARNFHERDGERLWLDPPEKYYEQNMRRYGSSPPTIAFESRDYAGGWCYKDWYGERYSKILACDFLEAVGHPMPTQVDVDVTDFL